MSLLLFDGRAFTPFYFGEPDDLVDHIDHIEEHADLDVRPSGLIVVREHQVASEDEDLPGGMYL